MTYYAIHYGLFWLVDYSNLRLEWSVLHHRRLLMDLQSARAIASIITRDNSIRVRVVAVQVPQISP